MINENKYFSDTDNIAKTIVLKSNSDIIDCRGAMFLNKCNINETILPQIVDKDFIKAIRDIDEDDNAKMLSGK